MKQIAVMSGKGGAGKTSVAAALIKLLPAVIAVDADVNASNLPILLQPEERIEEDAFFGTDIAQIRSESCSHCGQCQKICAFDAISISSQGNYVVNNNCEGCAACVWICPSQSIHTVPYRCGTQYFSRIENGYLIHADLNPGADNSGKLIAATRAQSMELAQTKNFGIILIDGPPGTSCQAISSLTGVDLVLVVLEESLSGLSDYRRLAKLMDHFRLPHLVLLNKAGIDSNVSTKLERCVADCDGTIAARIPFDPDIPQALARLETLIDMPRYRSEIEKLCEQMLQRL